MRLVLALSALLAVAPGARAKPPIQRFVACCTATIRVRVPESTGTVYLAGSLPERGPWRPDGLALTGPGRERTAVVTAPPGTTFEYKFTLGTWNREALGYAGVVSPNHRLVIPSDTLVVHEITDFKKDPREYIADWRGSGAEAMAARVLPSVVTTSTPDTVPYIVRDIERGLRVPGGTRYLFDYGTAGLDSTYAPSHVAVRAWLQRQGLVEGRDFVVRRYEGATHNEASWRARLDDPLMFLFGRRRQ